MSGEGNMAVVWSCFAHASTGDFAALEPLLTPDYVLHPQEVRGIDGLRGLVSGYRDSLEDLSVTVEHQFAAGDDVATVFTVRGRHRGGPMGLPGTGRDVALSGIAVSRLRDGRIAEEWEVCDIGPLVQAAGASPAHATA